MMFHALICILTFAVLVYKSKRFKNNASLPPQVPWGLPIFGHLLYLGRFPCKKLFQWKKQYGPMYLINMGSFRTLVINDSKVLKEASKPVFSDRPPMPTFIKADNKGIVMTDYNEGGEQTQFLRKQIRIFNEKGSCIEEHLNDGLSEIFKLFDKQTGRPILIEDVFSPIVINAVWGLFTGSRFSTDDLDLRKLILEIKNCTEIPGILASLGNVIPWFANLFPGITGVTAFATSYQSAIKFTEEKIESKKSSYVYGQPRHILDAYLDLMHETKDPNSTFAPSRNFLPNTFGNILAAALDTTAAAIEWAVLLIGKFPHVQKKLQEEITRTVGDNSRLSVQNLTHMPYTKAVIAEVLRWSPLFPLGVPHYTKENAELCGFIIPKDTMLIQNTYGIHHDPDVWGDPEVFRPERFLDLDGKFKKSEHLVIFGHGRRLCLGDSISQDILFIIIARLFQRFDVSFGNANPSLEMKIFGFITHPKPFRVIFTQRY